MSSVPDNDKNQSAGDGASKRRAQARGPHVIADYVRRLPNKPGVYRMLSETGDVLYVGKAHSLKKRVASYTKFGGQSNRIARMIHETAAMEFVVTATETEALLLEANLIKRLKPRFNVVLRDDKSFPYILVRRDHEAPQILKHRGGRKIEGDYYGPFASAGAVNRTLDTLQKAFLLRTCSDSVYEGRTRPCMLHQIKRCSAPCTGEISQEDYAKLVEQANDFLCGNSDALMARLQKRMETAAESMEFEAAAELRDRLRALTAVTETQGINPQGVEEADVIALALKGGQSCVQVFFFRAGQNWGNRSYFPKHDADASEGEVLGAFLAQFYDNKPAPRQILTSHEFEEQALLAEALAVRTERKVEIRAPRRGEKLGLVKQAQANALEALTRKLAETATQAKLLDGVAETFGLDGPPERIEVYDNSHIMGASALGAMIVAGPDGFVKNQYRKFNIKRDETEPGDDYAMMREVLSRRFSRLLKEEEKGAGARPDLVLIDGGKGQLSAVMEVMTELGLTDIPVVGVAKGPDRDAGRETFFFPDRAPMRLEPSSPVLYYLQRLRDEAHRFAIGSHRAKRSANAQKNPLDEIPGVGAARKKALLSRFGSARGVQRAALADLEKTPGVSSAVARKVYDWFHENE